MITTPSARFWATKTKADIAACKIMRDRSTDYTAAMARVNAVSVSESAARAAALAAICATVAALEAECQASLNAPSKNARLKTPGYK